MTKFILFFDDKVLEQSIIAIIILSLCLQLLCSCKMSGKFDDTFQDETFSIADRININYPVFKSSILADLNVIMYDYVIGIFNNEAYNIEELYADIDYRITLLTSDMISIIFEGEYNVRSAAHPVSFFDSITVDLNTKAIMHLSDFYYIDNNFANTVRDEYQKQIRGYYSEKWGVPLEQVPTDIESELDYLELDDFVLLLRMADYANSEIHSFITNEKIGISLPIVHAMGDHCEIYLDR